MEWLAELREGFRRIRQAQAAARVSFAARANGIGEIGREFNALAEALEQQGSNRLAREQVHRLRNRLAGILAALHVLGEGSAGGPGQADQLEHIVEEARKLDQELLARRSRSG